MADFKSAWQRVRRIFQPNEPPPYAAPPADARRAGAGSAARPPAPLPLTNETAATTWWQRREARHARAQEMSIRMLELADSLQDHFRRQDERAVELSGALERVGSTLNELAESQRAQSQYLRTIAEQTESAGRQTAALAGTLSKLPESVQAQADAIRTVARHLEVAQEADTQLMFSLQRFGQAVDTLSTSGTAQVEVLQRLSAAQAEQHESLTALVRQQSRRFVIVTMIVVVVALAGLAVVTALLWRTRWT
jgi:hypothetical protein